MSEIEIRLYYLGSEEPDIFNNLDFSEIKDILNVVNVIIMKGKFDNLEFLKPFINTIYIEISSRVRVKSLTGLEEFKKLEELQCKDNLLTSIEPLNNCEALQELYLSGNRGLRISSEDLINCRNLTDLDISYTSVDNLLFVYHLPKLTCLDCGKTEISTLQGIERWNRLKWLTCSETSIFDIAPARGCKNLEWLCVSDCKQLISIDEIMNFRFIENLYIDGAENLTNFAEVVKSLDCLQDLFVDEKQNDILKGLDIPAIITLQ